MRCSFCNVLSPGHLDTCIFCTHGLLKPCTQCDKVAARSRIRPELIAELRKDQAKTLRDGFIRKKVFPQYIRHSSQRKTACSQRSLTIQKFKRG